MATIIDGTACAAEVRREVATRIAARTSAGQRAPSLVTILVGDDPASKVYVARKHKACDEVGMSSESVVLPADTTQAAVQAAVQTYNERDDVDGILVQLPLPSGLDSDAVVASLDPGKDVDGLHPHNQGALLAGKAGLRPCTPAGCLRLLDWAGIDPAGRRAVVVGRSLLVGKPVALMLLERNATVSVAHSRTADLPGLIAEADILVAAVGKPSFIRGEWVKPGATVLDVGINRGDDGLVGDVDFEGVAARAGAITPVPGGVGPMTVAMLLRNTLDACQARQALPLDE